MSLDTSVISSDAKRLKLEHVGRFVTGEVMVRQFEQIVQSFTPSGIIDVTGWTPEAIRVLLVVCRENMQVISLRAGKKYLTPILHRDGPLFDTLIETIVSASKLH
ncbi:MAG: hypothetical protein P1Q69_11725 [Candidatus Thorarchaeota archaeon]|nr:hypothetical protein [Candidatus Thorarchaeota archaeon]